MLTPKQRAAMYLLLSELDQTIEAHAFRLASAETKAYPTPFEVDDARDVLVAQLATFLTYSSSGIQISIAPEGDAFTLFGVGLDGATGFAVVTLPAEELAALPETPEENTLIATGTETTYWGEVNVYQLTTGELQVNVGPDAEGKVRVTIYDAIPPTRVYGYEFNVLLTP
jgi:hypothetical protein